jgi:hypothetical protein
MRPSVAINRVKMELQREPCNFSFMFESSNLGAIEGRQMNFVW